MIDVVIEISDFIARGEILQLRTARDLQKFVRSRALGVQLTPELKPISLYVGTHLHAPRIKGLTNPSKQKGPQVSG